MRQSSAPTLIPLISSRQEDKALLHLKSNPASAYERHTDGSSVAQMAIVFKQRSIFAELLRFPEQFSAPDNWGNTVVWTAFFEACKGDCWYLANLLPVFSEIHSKNKVGKSVWSASHEISDATINELLRPFAPGG